MKRLHGRLPKIGIRPCVDGRRNGVREELEPQILALSGKVAAFLSSSLRHSCGEPVQCVIPETCIGGVAESAMCAELFGREGVGLSITVTSCWCYGSETMDMDPHMPKAVWGVNGTERPGAVYLASVLAAHGQKGLPVFGIYGRDVQDADDLTIPDDVKDRLLVFARAALAAAELRGKSYLSIGSVSMGIAGCMVNEDFFQGYLGMRNEYVDMSEITRRVSERIYDEAEYAKAIAWVRANCREGKDNNRPEKAQTRAEMDANWETSVKMALIVRDLMVGNPSLRQIGRVEESMGHNAIVSGFQGQRSWTDHFPNGDFLEAILNSSFDWNGIRQPYLVSTENDSLNGVAMAFGHLLTNGAQVFVDVRTYWSPTAMARVSGIEASGAAAGGVIHLTNSGAAAVDGAGMQECGGVPAMKPFWDITPEEAALCLENCRWRPANRDYFRGGGYSSNFLTRGGMPLTMSRVNLIKGLGPVLQLAEGHSADLPAKAHEAMNERTDPTWPTTWFVPNLTGGGAFRDVYSVMANWGANHGVLSHGHIGRELIALCALLRIPVSMHNVPAERVCRPAMWPSFGTSEPEGADYRACKALGPLYG